MVDVTSIAKGLKLGEDGIWYSLEAEKISYPQGGNEACFNVEDRSFWFRHRKNCILTVIQSYPPERGGTIFDIGGGNGFISSALENEGLDVVLVEPGRTGAVNGKRRGLKTVICSATAGAGFRPGTMSAVGLFDVLEHIKDDLVFLKSLAGLIKKQGRLYITVPAYSFLWSGEDVLAGHYRRYTCESICAVIQQAGFTVEFFSYIFRILPAPIALFRVLPYRMGLLRSKNKVQKVARDHAVQGGMIANALASFLNSELENLKNNKPMRFGGSCLVVASKGVTSKGVKP